MAEDTTEGQATAESLIATEIARQNAMWGPNSERSDVADGQLMLAAMAQLEALYLRQNGEADAFERKPEIYPDGWAGFRDYGSDIANLVVTAAFIQQEIRRKLAAGEDHTRLARDPAAQTYGTYQPNAVEP